MKKIMFFCTLIIVIVLSFSWFTTNENSVINDVESYNYTNENNMSYTLGKRKYLSNMSYEHIEGTININKDTKSIEINGQEVNFFDSLIINGSIIYNISDENYDLLSLYKDNGTLEIFTSINGSVWHSKYKNDDENINYVEVDVKKTKYLKIVANNVLLANSCIMEDKEEKVLIKEVEYYNDLLREKDLKSIVESDELLLLQKSFVERLGYEQLMVMYKYDQNYYEMFNWLINNNVALKYFITGGDSFDDYESIITLAKIYEKYKNDLNNDGLLKLAISIALTNKGLERYGIYRNMYLEKLMEKDLFDSLSVEEMRLVVGSDISNEEIITLNNRSRIFGEIKKYNLNPYSYNDNYSIVDRGVYLNNVYGIPSIVLEEPGNSLYVAYTKVNKQGRWYLYNSKYGWSKTKSTKRLLNGWGNSSWNNSFNGSYMLLANDALNEIEKYEKSMMVISLVSLYSNDLEKLEEIYRLAIDYQSINIDAWYGLINIYNRLEKTEEEYYKLATKMADSMYNYPIVMSDLLSLISDKFLTDDYKMKYNCLIREYMEVASLSNNVNTKKIVSDLFQKEQEISFSFDGEYKNSLISKNNKSYEYSIDNAKSWHYVTDSIYPLNVEELSLLNDVDDILIRYDENIEVIDIKKQSEPLGIYVNDYENKIIGTNSTLEWSVNGVDWSQDMTHIFEGDQSILIRKKATNNLLASSCISLSFSENVIDPHFTYINSSEIKALEKNENNLVVELKKSYYLSAIEYPLEENLEIYISINNKEWHKIEGENVDKLVFEPIKVKYIKFIVGDLNISKINLFYDATKKTIPKVDLEYSITDFTNQDVVVKVINPSEEITILNNDGSDTYTFTKNGEFEFIFQNVDGIKSRAKARVTWIDKEVPKVNINYSINTLTNKVVRATLSEVDEEIIILNNNGNNFYDFYENGKFEFKFQDKAGNMGEISALVDWIDKEIPSAEINYSNITNDKVVARLNNASEEITVLNNDGSNTYTFTKNGEFVFKYQDKAGNIGVTNAKVDWLLNSENQVETIVDNVPEKTYKLNSFEVKRRSLEDKKLYLKVNRVEYENEKIDGELVGYEIYFRDGFNQRINSSLKPMDIVYFLSKDNYPLKIYELDGDDLKEVVFTKSNNSIKFSDEELNTYIFVYEKEEIEVYEKNKSMIMIPVLLFGSFLGTKFIKSIRRRKFNY